MQLILTKSRTFNVWCVHHCFRPLLKQIIVASGYDSRSSGWVEGHPTKRRIVCGELGHLLGIAFWGFLYFQVRSPSCFFLWFWSSKMLKWRCSIPVSLMFHAGSFSWSHMIWTYLNNQPCWQKKKNRSVEPRDMDWSFVQRWSFKNTVVFLWMFCVVFFAISQLENKVQVLLLEELCCKSWVKRSLELQDLLSPNPSAYRTSFSRTCLFRFSAAFATAHNAHYKCIDLMEHSATERKVTVWMCVLQLF